jgi:hypothetical protein
MKFLKNYFFYSIAFFALLSCGTSSYVEEEPQYINPDWAPAYSPGVRYYYFPDIEVYYDLSARDYVYLQNGQWLFSSTLPPYYHDYDLYNGYIVALDYNSFQPWRHHHYYVSHYPRYYYYNVYPNDPPRGFNENGRKTYHRKEVRPKINPPPKQIDPAPKPEEAIQPKFSREPQSTNYYGRQIGKPVKVTPKMKENKKEMQRDNTNVKRNSPR